MKEYRVVISSSHSLGREYFVSSSRNVLKLAEKFGRYEDGETIYVFPLHDNTNLLSCARYSTERKKYYRCKTDNIINY